MDELNCTDKPFALTGDDEIDSVFPNYPRLLPELSMMQVGADRLILLGGLSAPILPLRSGSLDIAAFLEQLDGRHHIAQLCTSSNGSIGEKKKLLFALLRLGVLEEGEVTPVTGRHRKMDEVGSDTVAFLAKVMDQTRVHNDRKNASAAFLETVVVVGRGQFCTGLANRLAEFGMRVKHVEDWLSEGLGTTPTKLVIAINDERFEQDAAINAMQGHRIPTLLITPYADALDVGPLLLSRGTCTISCYRRERDLLATELSAQTDSGMSHVWLPIIGNVVVLLAGNMSALPLVNNFIRYQNTDAGIRTQRHAVARTHALQGAPIPLAATAASAAPARLQRHSRMALPPRRMVGAKSHDAHYASKNVKAAREFPLPHGRPIIDVLNANAAQRRLLQLIEHGFGYWEDKAGNLKRVCPSGGNLGSAECLVVWRQPGATLLLRYVPLHGHLEMVMQAAATDRADALAEYEIICLANQEKTSRKYFDFGMSLAFIDAGVAAAFMHATANKAGISLPVQYTPAFEEPVLRALQHRAHYYAFAWRTAFPGGQDMLPAADLTAFDGMLARRSAARNCTGLGLSVDAIQSMLLATRPVADDALVRALLEQLSPVLCVQRDGPSDVFVLRQGASLAWVPLPESGLVRGVQGQELLSQQNLSQAPALLFLLADLPAVLQQFGDHGHDQLLVLCGQWVGAFWLALEQARHRGCPAGAAVEADLLSNLPAQMGHLFNLFSFTFGQNAEAG